MRLAVSAPMQLVLVATVVGSVVLLLHPEPAELPLPVSARTLSAAEKRIAAQDTSPREDRPWSRPPLSEPAITKAAVQPVSGMPPLPPPGVESDASATPPLPPLPVGQSKSDVVYLGRMIKDDKVQVFFSSNGEPLVLSTGDVLDGSWRIEAISTTDVTLRHLLTGKTRLIATGGSIDQRPASAAPDQVGQRFLASQPIQQQQPN
jgi:hypothetical protein